jgi:hypothetical protein
MLILKHVEYEITKRDQLDGLLSHICLLLELE